MRCGSWTSRGHRDWCCWICGWSEWTGWGFSTRWRPGPTGSAFRVILMSADRAVRQLEHAPGVVAVLQKPFELADLLALIAQHGD